jgi:hypothetical protein
MLNPKQAHLTKHDLKKQSQFAAVQSSAKPFLKGDYENKSRRGLRENKPKQSQIQTGRLLTNRMCPYSESPSVT